MTWANAKIKKIYVGESLVYPVVYCDFTKSDCGFTWLWTNDTSWYTTHWIDSNWLYLASTRAANFVWAWLIPSSIYSKWTIRKIELEFNSTGTQNWWWICTKTAQYDAYTLRTWRNNIDNIYNSTNTQNTVTNPSGIYTLTIDLENWKEKITNSSEFTIPSNLVSWFNTNIPSGNVWICAMRSNLNTSTIYIKSAKFYF